VHFRGFASMNKTLTREFSVASFAITLGIGIGFAAVGAVQARLAQERLAPRLHSRTMTCQVQTAPGQIICRALPTR
jgi:hypothetical protein